MIDDFQPRRPQPRPEVQPRQNPVVQAAVQSQVVTPPAANPIETIEIDDTPDKPLTNLPLDKPKRRLPIWLNPKTWSKKQWVLAIIVLLVLISGITGAILAFTNSEPTFQPQQAAAPAPEAKPEPILSPLTGAEVSAEQAKWPVIGVMIENSSDARPQSGLDKAGVVYEAVAEGGITRFLALYQEGDPDYLGPIRSVRPYYLDWLTGNDAAVAHVGGSPEALAKIKANGIKDLDQFSAAGSYNRISSRSAPHNMYSSLARLRDLSVSRGYTSSNFKTWDRKTDSKAATPSASSIDFTLSSALYNVHYDYDPADNAYHRSEGGKPHMVVDSAGTQNQLKPKVVIGLVTNKSIKDGKYSEYTTTGSGTAFIYQDGKVTNATWTKLDAKTNISFTDASGQPVKLNTGQTWISVIDAPGKASAK